MIRENIAFLLEKIQNVAYKTGRENEKISLLAVSKTFSSELILEAYNAGIMNFAENFVQEFLKKEVEISNKEICWHFIGHLQSNKVKYIIDKVKTIQSVDSLHLADEIQKRAEQKNLISSVFVEVNTSNESTKFGVAPDEAIEFIAKIGMYKNIKIDGLMTIGPFTDKIDESRKSFQTLYDIKEKINDEKILPYKLTELSMGMSHDFETAIEEGSTMLRVGTAIFGNRNYK